MATHIHPLREFVSDTGQQGEKHMEIIVLWIAQAHFLLIIGWASVDTEHITTFDFVRTKEPHQANTELSK